MNVFRRFAPLPLLVFAVAILAAGCHGKQDQNAANQPASTDQTQSQSADPASANLAPIPNASGAATTSGSSDQQAAPIQSASSQSAPDQSAPVADDASATDDSNNGEQPVATAPDPPPALPDYDQPPAPGDGYLWTPGYWGYASAGYYWVPGVWVQAPYEGALWTPGYWGFAHGHYGYFRGYWGPHIGFYGGVNYGFGYGGTGYQGGYWNSGHFFYNRTVSNINVSVIHNVYEHPVQANNVRVSFHGGQGGVVLRPRPAELVALREPHAAPMQAQLQHEHAASLDRAQFVSVNHGRPANVVIAKPLEADRSVHPVVAPEPRNMPQRVPPPQHAAPEARPNPATQDHRNPPGRPEPARPEAAPRPAEHPAARPAQRPAEHPAPAPRPAEHAAPAPHSAEHPAPAPRPAEHSAPPPHQAEHAAPRPDAHPAPQPKPAPEHPKKPEAGVLR